MKTYSIRAARENLAQLADAAEAGEPVRITRSGHAALVLICERDFRKLPSQDFFDRLVVLRKETGGVDFERPSPRPTQRRVHFK